MIKKEYELGIETQDGARVGEQSASCFPRKGSIIMCVFFANGFVFREKAASVVV